MLIYWRNFTFIAFLFIGGTPPSSHAHLLEELHLHRIIIYWRNFPFIACSFIGGTSPSSHAHLLEELHLHRMLNYWRNFTFIACLFMEEIHLHRILIYWRRSTFIAFSFMEALHLRPYHHYLGGFTSVARSVTSSLLHLFFAGGCFKPHGVFRHNHRFLRNFTSTAILLHRYHCYLHPSLKSLTFGGGYDFSSSIPSAISFTHVFYSHSLLTTTRLFRGEGGHLMGDEPFHQLLS